MKLKSRHLEKLSDYLTMVLHSDRWTFNHQQKFPAQTHGGPLLATPVWPRSRKIHQLSWISIIAWMGIKRSALTPWLRRYEIWANRTLGSEVIVDQRIAHRHIFTYLGVAGTIKQLHALTTMLDVSFRTIVSFPEAPTSWEPWFW